MFIRPRRFRAAALLAALLVSWTAGPAAAFCLGAQGEAEMAADGHAAHGAAGGHHHGAPPQPPAGGEEAPAAPECPWMAMSGGACLVAPAPPPPRGAAAALPPAAEYPHASEVRDQLLGAALFRPPKG